MKWKICVLVLVFLVSISIALASGAASYVIIEDPATSESITGTAYELKVNASNTNIINITYVWIKAKCTVCSNSSYVEIATINATQPDNNSLRLNVTFDSTVLEDSPDYTIQVIAANFTNNYMGYNGTMSEQNRIVDTTYGENFTAVTSTSVELENTVPGAVTFYVSVTDSAIYLSAPIDSKNVSSCRVVFSGNNPGSSVYTLLDYGSNNASYSEQIRVATGSYTFTGDCVDHTLNTTTGSTVTFSHTSSEGQSGLGGFLVATGQAEVLEGGAELAVEEPSGIGKIGGMGWNWILAIVGFVIGMFFIALPIPLPIPPPFKALLGAIGLAILGYWLGGML